MILFHPEGEVRGAQWPFPMHLPRVEEFVQDLRGV